MSIDSQNTQLVKTFVTKFSDHNEQFLVVRNPLTQEKFLRFFTEQMVQDVPLEEFKAALAIAEKEENIAHL
jgi:hypothetical protein